jgi:hypothetical protein
MSDIVQTRARRTVLSYHYSFLEENGCPHQNELEAEELPED